MEHERVKEVEHKPIEEVDDSSQKTIDYLVDRFSENLTKFDVQTLFESLREKKGSLSAATKEIDIQRKTVYDWESNSSEIKLLTKRKILEANLNDNALATVAYLFKKNVIDYSDIAERYVNMIFDCIMTSDNKIQLQDFVHSFEKNLKSNKSLLYCIDEDKIQAMIDLVNQKANAYGIAEITNDLHLMSTEKLAQRFLLLVDVFSEKKLPKSEIANALKLPSDFVEKACAMFGYLDPPTKTNDAIRHAYEKSDIKDADILERDKHLKRLPVPSYIATREY